MMAMGKKCCNDQSGEHYGKRDMVLTDRLRYKMLGRPCLYRKSQTAQPSASVL
jgi:hypothetical protein